MQNEHEERSIDAIFAEKQSRETEIRALEEAVESERRAKETVVSGMQPHELEQYRRLKAENIRVEKVRGGEGGGWRGNNIASTIVLVYERRKHAYHSKLHQKALEVVH